jgi:histidine triad (HIT) family protein
VSDCLFCGIVAGDVPAEIVHRSERAVAFRDLHPMAPVHVLVVPVRHLAHAGVVGAEDADDVAALFAAARAVAEAEGLDDGHRGYRLTFNVGPDAGMSVPHLHMHLLGGRSLGWPPG